MSRNCSRQRCKGRPAVHVILAPAVLAAAFCTVNITSTSLAQSQVAQSTSSPKEKRALRVWNASAFRGPIPTRNMDPLGELFLLPLPTGGSVLDKRATRLDVALNVGNNFVGRTTTTQSFVTDFEEQRLTVGYARGLGNRQEVSVHMPFVARNNGLFDKLIENYDNLFNLSGNNRDRAPSGRNIYRVTDAAGNSLINTTSSEIGLGDMTLEYRYGLTRKAASERKRPLQAAFRGLLKLPTGSKSKVFGSGGFDFGAGLAATWQPSRRWALHGNLTEVFPGDPDNNSFVTRSQSLNTVVAAEYQLRPKTSLVIQGDRSDLPIRNAFATSKPRQSLTLGFWHTASERKSYYLSFSENKLGPFGESGIGSAPDFAFALGLRFHH